MLFMSSKIHLDWSTLLMLFKHQNKLKLNTLGTMTQERDKGIIH